MQLLIGTSGFSYKEWKGTFYPSDLPDKRMLAHYSTQLRTVEINNTFYRMPKTSVVERWAEDVPEGFVFVIKASQRITHRARLKNAGDSIEYLWNALQALGPHLGPVLFQLPPNFRQDPGRLREFLAELPAGLRAAFEFRHQSWSDESTLDVLREGGAALCSSDREGGLDPDGTSGIELHPTTDWGYLRLRGTHYTDEDLSRWVERLAATGWKEAFVFFKHEGAEGPEMARHLARLSDSEP